MNNHAIESDVQHLIEVRQVGKDYQSGEATVQAIKEMSLYIDDGEFVSIRLREINSAFHSRRPQSSDPWQNAA